MHYIAKAKRRELLEKLSQIFSILMDGSTDSGNIDNDTNDTNNSDKKVHIKTEYFHVLRPASVAASGLFDCLDLYVKKTPLLITAALRSR